MLEMSLPPHRTRGNAPRRRTLAAVSTPILGAIALWATAAGAHTPVFDAHVHLWSDEASLRAYRADVAGLDVEVAGLAAMWFGGPNQAVPGRIAEIRAGNDSILALARANPDLVPVVTVHPYDGAEALAELERVAALGARVLKIHPHTQGFDAADPRVLVLVRRGGELGLIVLMDNAGILPGDSEKLFNLALAAPETRFIFAHAGGLNFRFWNILKLVRTAENLFADNIWFDISGPSTLAADSPIEAEFVWTLRNIGVDRILLGSDYPQLPLSDALDALERLDLTEDEKARIRYGNARLLFGL